MKKNVGKIDKVIRILITAVLLVLYFTNIITGTLGIVALVLSGILIVTSIFGFCPAYFPFGLTTRQKE